MRDRCATVYPQFRITRAAVRDAYDGDHAQTLQHPIGQSHQALDIRTCVELRHRAARMTEQCGAVLSRISLRLSKLGSDVSETLIARTPTLMKRSLRALIWLMVAVVMVWLVQDAIGIGKEIKTDMTGTEMLHVVWLGVLTLLRVAAMTVLATLFWTPIGVWIGLHPQVARIAQPLAQIGASFPVNMTFPFMVAFFIATNIPINFGSILLMALGTQWYILFNVIAGAMAIPTDLKEAAGLFGLRNWRLWKTLIIPAIFPFWVTGAVTATGGAWNASIVAEVASWGHDKLVADGLGAYISQVTEKGDKPAIYFSIAVMAVFVVFINRVLWRRLYALAERKYKLE